MMLLKNQIIINYKSLIRKAQSPYEIMKYVRLKLLNMKITRKTRLRNLKRLDVLDEGRYAQPISPIKKEKPDIGKMLDENIKKNGLSFVLNLSFTCTYQLMV